jgi:hypothetical protein
MARAAARRLAKEEGARSAALGLNAAMHAIKDSNLAKGEAIAHGVALINSVWGRLASPVMFGVGSPLGPSISNVRGSDGQPLIPSAYDRETGNQNILNSEQNANSGGKAIDQSGAGHAANSYLDGPEEGPTELFP